MRAGAEPWWDENHEGCEKRGPRLTGEQILLVEGKVRRLEGLDIEGDRASPCEMLSLLDYILHQWGGPRVFQHKGLDHGIHETLPQDAMAVEGGEN